MVCEEKIYLPNRIRLEGWRGEKVGTCVSIVTFGIHAHVLIHHIHLKSGAGGGAFTPNFTVLVPYRYTKPGGLAHVPLSCVHSPDVHMHTATAQTIVCVVGVYIVTNHTWVLCKTLALSKGWTFTPR